MDALSVMENRIEQLESKLGYPDEELGEMSEPVVEQLLSAEAVLNSATSGREKIVEINRRIEELNSYLDPQYVNQVTDGKLKSNYVLTLEPYIHNYCQSTELCQQKSAVLNTEPISNIAALSASLEKMRASNIENREHCEQVEKCIQQAMETYNQVSMTVMENLAGISKKIDVLEKAQSK